MMILFTTLMIYLSLYGSHDPLIANIGRIELRWMDNDISKSMVKCHNCL